MRFALYTEIQDGCQKWRENDFWTKLPDDCEYPGPGFTKILKLMLKLRHIISVFVSREIMLKLVFSKVISGENKLKLSLYVSKHFIG